MAILLIFLAIHLCQAGQTDSQCHVNCQSCSRQNTCYKCKPGYFNDTRRLGGCTQCPQGCSDCSSWQDCVSCESGYFLSNNWCFSCSKYLHAWQCSKGCVNGFYGQFCNVSCSEGCRGKECNKQSGRCVNGCLKGYYGETCHQCSEWCLNMTCKQVDGRCTHGCVDGYYEYERRCERCSDNCKTCSSSTTCASCYDGSYKDKCDTSCPYCKPGGCHFRNGTCTNGCKDGYFQSTNMCLPCPDKCSKCKSITFCVECQSGYFGKTCEQRCFNNFLSCSDNDNCNKTSNAVSSCFQENGTCLYGCVSGFTGHNCTDVSLCIHFLRSWTDSAINISAIQQRTMDLAILAITGSALGVVVIVAAAVTLMLLVRSRRNQVTRSSVGVDSDRQHVRCSIRNPIHDDSVDNYTSLLETNPDADNHVYAVVQ